VRVGAFVPPGFRNHRGGVQSRVGIRPLPESLLRAWRRTLRQSEHAKPREQCAATEAPDRSICFPRTRTSSRLFGRATNNLIAEDAKLLVLLRNSSGSRMKQKRLKFGKTERDGRKSRNFAKLISVFQDFSFQFFCSAPGIDGAMPSKIYPAASISMRPLFTA
jgi:hypothetical protein